MPTTDLFLTHDWGKDEDGRNNHLTVSTINEALKSMGYVTWFDNDRMEGNIPEQMALGIEKTKVVLAFITKRYEDKVTGDNSSDNCKLEFNYATLNKTSSNIIAIVMEKRMRNPKIWRGTLGMYLGNKLFTDMSGDINDDDYFHGQLQLLSKEIQSMGVIPRNMAPLKELKSFLHSISLEQYLPTFEETGNEDLDDLSTIAEEELDDILIKDVGLKSGHARKFAKSLKIRRSGQKPIDPSVFQGIGPHSPISIISAGANPMDFNPSNFQGIVPVSPTRLVSPVHAVTDECGKLNLGDQKLQNGGKFEHSSEAEVHYSRANKTPKEDNNDIDWKTGRFEIMKIVRREIATDWRMLGQLLRIPSPKLNGINIDEHDIYNKAAKCLEVWENSIQHPSLDILKAALEQIPRRDIIRQIEDI